MNNYYKPRHLRTLISDDFGIFCKKNPLTRMRNLKKNKNTMTIYIGDDGSPEKIKRQKNKK